MSSRSETPARCPVSGSAAPARPPRRRCPRSAARPPVRRTRSRRRRRSRSARSCSPRGTTPRRPRVDSTGGRHRLTGGRHRLTYRRTYAAHPSAQRAPEDDPQQRARAAAPLPDEREAHRRGAPRGGGRQGQAVDRRVQARVAPARDAVLHLLRQAARLRAPAVYVPRARARRARWPESIAAH